MQRTLLGALAVLSLILFLSVPSRGAAQGRWLKAESANFVIYTNADARSAQRFSTQLETFDQTLRSRHGLAADQPVRRKLPIYVLQRDGDMRRIRPGVPAELRGFYTSTLEDTYAVAIVDEANDPTLLHEYAHHFMLGRFPSGYPGWLVEGYAEYYMTFRQTPEFLEVGRANDNRGVWLVRGTWLPFERVLRARPSDLKRGSDMAMFYAQSWALTHWFLSDPARARQLDAYLNAVGRGEESVKAMTAATGMTPQHLTRALRTYLDKGFPVRRLPLITATTTPAVVAPLPASASDLLLLGLRVKGDNGIDAPSDRTDGPVLLNDVRRAAAKHPGDALADRALARVEIKLGDLSQAETLLQRRIAADPGDVEALQLLASARLKAAERVAPPDAAKLRAEAREFAGRAFKLDADNYQTLVAYAQAREGVRNYPTDNDVKVLEDALDLAPQVGILRVKAATALMARNRRSEAADTLRPLAFNPHGGPAVEAARAMLALLEAGAPAPTAAAGTAGN